MKKDNQKSILRIRTKELLKTLPWKRRQAAPHRAFTNLKEKLQHFGHILSFTSFGTEIDLWPLNAVLAKQEKLYLPHYSGKIFKVMSLSFLHTGPNPNLEPNPSFCQEASIEQMDCILLPGLLFDRQGVRLGFGGGFYDRLLEKRRPQTLLLGIGYEEQLSEELLPNDPHDVSVDELLLF